MAVVHLGTSPGSSQILIIQGSVPILWTTEFEARSGLHDPLSTLQILSVASLRKVYSVREARRNKAVYSAV